MDVRSSFFKVKPETAYFPYWIFSEAWKTSRVLSLTYVNRLTVCFEFYRDFFHKIFSWGNRRRLSCGSFCRTVLMSKKKKMCDIYWSRGLLEHGATGWWCSLDSCRRNVPIMCYDPEAIWRHIVNQYDFVTPYKWNDSSAVCYTNSNVSIITIYWNRRL